MLTIVITEHHKWRIFIDVQTNLPKREECYQKSGSENEYVLESIKIITYLADNEIKVLIENIFADGGAQ